MVRGQDEDGCEGDSENTDEIEDVGEAERKSLTVGRLKCRGRKISVHLILDRP